MNVLAITCMLFTTKTVILFLVHKELEAEVAKQ
ncbi:hypothetical protein CF65_01170 [Aggregatibacter actinomycetemcomitans HK1651]|nr:hypothetical protein CF65_01170 [Aggregatibacter actinomycetemcomitans HK1651]